jgi:hypothetical protein
MASFWKEKPIGPYYKKEFKEELIVWRTKV